ncbi:unnamed protein product, partial [Sphenostylis stenocarpa]
MAKLTVPFKMAFKKPKRKKGVSTQVSSPPLPPWTYSRLSPTTVQLAAFAHNR